MPVCLVISEIERPLLYKGAIISIILGDRLTRNSIKSRGRVSLLIGGSAHPNSFLRNWISKKLKSN